MTVDLNKCQGRPVDPINPYAVIALIAALLGLFPVAIVFGILAFWRPAGRRVAIAGLVIGAIEAIAVATVVYGFGTGLTVDDSTNATVYHDYSLPATPLEAPPTTVIVPSLTTPPPVETTIAVTKEPPLALPAVDDPCDPAVDNHATSSNDTFLKCAYAGRSTARWVRSAPIIAYADQGAPCDPSARGIAVSPGGVDMVCVSNAANQGGYWVPGP
ncbi:DUF4190 domain-containing protein [Rhodococcus sp. G-MC3]|uniref:DUF4190 domain-containing protein n=1 Tax=Rhodococcus sp. G-MC3 TaxID=3046209 RepID=UPI0024BA1BBE|nr:DUF4190 domain-containing protein [Rhodococcus sp. G-MC3]MDJ0395838.1 DUF4190 domain-containing protein [Rhodococcus sp. G-MC3]